MKIKVGVLILLIGFLSSSANSQLPIKGLIAWYAFNGNTNDSTINGYNLTNNNVTFTTDRFGHKNAAAFFDNGCSTCPPAYLYRNTLYLKDSFSYSVWIKPYSLKQLALVLYNSTLSDSAGNGIILTSHSDYTDSGNHVAIMLGYAVFWNVYDIFDYNWRHIVVTYSKGSGYNLFANGEFIGKDTLYSNNNSDTGLFVVGGFPGVSTSFIDFLYYGAIDDIRVYSRALQSPEIDSLYHEGGYNNEPTTISMTAMLKYKIYPNPMSRQLFIDNAENGDKVRLYDIMGREVYVGVVNNQKYFINTTDLSVGTYLLELTNKYGIRNCMTVVKQ